MSFGLWLKYFFHLPHRAAHANADFEAIVATAFGRNQYKDSELHLVNKLLAESHNFDFLAVQKLLENGFDPGAPNRKIAAICENLSGQNKKPLIVQWEIAAALDQNWYEHNLKRIFCIWPQKTGYFSTFDFAQEVNRLLKALNCSSFTLAGHHDHNLRTYLIFKKMGWNPIINPETVKIFDPKSVQKFTRSRKRWLIREMLTRIHHWFAEYV